eukprot:gnl/MRDRNA2_/MRDRNA2_102635_c0_seq1.p1 gnl/MRDRNA2_/MRDRNA2_102635_c0~~gnl/MRDRNA2_/MRDRNA2_102635_c0_seq1.p1  ORF type:complete len:388 (-),score=86.84 gnl/MRDRNA2_/MRDRNA2_102635_c0_seq1:269-1432(-)
MGAACSTESTDSWPFEMEQASLTPRAWSHSWHDPADCNGADESPVKFLLPSTLVALDEENLYTNTLPQTELASVSRPPVPRLTIDIQEAQKHNPFNHSSKQQMTTPSTSDESPRGLNMTPREGFSGSVQFDDTYGSEASSYSDSEYSDDSDHDEQPVRNLYFSLNDSSDEEDMGGDLVEQYTFDLSALAATLDAGASTAELEQHVRAILLSARGRPQEADCALRSARGHPNKVYGALLSARGQAQNSIHGKADQLKGAMLSARGSQERVRAVHPLLSARGQPQDLNGTMLSIKAKSKGDAACLSARGKPEVIMKCTFTPRFVRKSFGGEPEAAQSLDKAVQETVAAAWKLHRQSLTKERDTTQSTRVRRRKSSIREASDHGEVPMAG